MTGDRYRTVEGRSEGTLREKASRFIGIAFPVKDEDALDEELQRIAGEQHAARHICHAFVLGEDGSRHRSSDAGEPSGTAGPPILRAIQGMGLTFTAVAVVRYFGGTLLGKGGLVRAYGDAARLALANASIGERIVMEHVRFSCSLALFEVLKRELAAMHGEVVRKEFSERCSGTVAVPRGRVNEAMDRWLAMGIDAQRTDQLK